MQQDLSSPSITQVSSVRHESEACPLHLVWARTEARFSLFLTVNEEFPNFT
jgi:hypothetical protein